MPELAWYGARLREFALLSEWRVSVSRMAGHDRPALTADSIAAALGKPVDCEPLSRLANPHSRVAIVFDDMSRITRCQDIVPALLAELARAGVPDGSIRFIGATGSHRAMDRLDFVKKLGEQIPRRFAVYSHNPFGDCVSVGTTSQGVQISVNAELMSCNLKIAIGSVVPHRAVGFSGGPKTVLPGICSMETIKSFHRYEVEAGPGPAAPVLERPLEAGHPAWDVCDEAARLVGLNFKIDVLVNSFGETAALYAGQPAAVYQLAKTDACRHYLTKMVPNANIVIANTYAKVNEYETGLSIAFPSAAAGAYLVLIANSPEGHIPHYLFGSWGTEAQRRHANIPIPERIRRLYVFSEYPDPTLLDYFQNRDKVALMTRWEDILKDLFSSQPKDAIVAIYPNADIQYCQ